MTNLTVPGPGNKLSQNPAFLFSGALIAAASSATAVALQIPHITPPVRCTFQPSVENDLSTTETARTYFVVGVAGSERDCCCFGMAAMVGTLSVASVHEDLAFEDEAVKVCHHAQQCLGI